MSESSALPVFDSAIMSGVQAQSLKPTIKPRTGKYSAVVNRLNTKAGEFKFKDASGADRVVPCHRIWLGYSIPEGIGQDGNEVSWPGEIATILAPSDLAQVPLSERWKGNGLPGATWEDGSPNPGAVGRLLANVAACLAVAPESVAADFNGSLASLKSSIDAGLRVSVYVKNKPAKKEGGEPFVQEFIQSIEA